MTRYISNVKSTLVCLCLIVSANSLFAQHLTNCGILNAVLNNSLVRKKLYLSKNTDSTYRIYDMKGLVKDCHPEPIYGKNVEVLDSSLLDRAHFSRLTHIWEIMVYNISKEGQIYSLVLHQRGTGMVGHIELKERKGMFVVTKVSIIQE